MTGHKQSWSADPLIWGQGSKQFEIFLEPTCPFSGRAFDKLDALLESTGEDNVRIVIWLQSQPWHMFSGIICRAIIAVSTLPGGKENAKALMKAIFAARAEFEFDEHRDGPNLEVTPNTLIARMEVASGLPIAEAFQLPGLEKEIKRHCRYARQNGIHVSPTFIVDGLIAPNMSSGDAVEEWASALLV